MKYRLFITAFLICVYRLSPVAQINCYNNPSMEGPSQAHVVPSPWNTCWGSPDTQPGQWGITLPPSDGTSYVSFLASNNYGYLEGMTQPLTTCMVAGQTYSFTVDLAHTNIYNTAGPGDCYSSIAVWGGNSSCSRTELLYCSGEIWNTNWQSYTITFTPTGNWCYIGFSPCYLTPCSGYINLMMDNISCVAPINALVTSTDVTCFGACNGTAIANPISGTPPYTYLWSPGGQTSQSITGLCPGTYSVTVTDAASKTTTGSVVVIQPAQLTVSITKTNVSCLGGSNGTASANATGGTTAYTYLWSNGSSSSAISGLIAGNYILTVTDSKGCQVISNTTILAGGVVAANISATVNVSCNGGNNGSATVTVSDGIPNYTYLWSNGQTSSTVVFLPAGPASVTITDAMGCTTTVSTNITQPPVLTASISSSTNVTCKNLCNGTANLSVSGGTAPYTYLWNNGQTTIGASGLCAGNASVNITDAKGCTVSNSVVITEPALLALSTSIVNPGCVDSCDGSASVTAVGGVIPYTFQWNDPGNQTSTTANNLCDGAYVITVTDSNGCIAVATVVLSDPPLFVASIASKTDVNCNGNCTGYAQAASSGGGAPYTYIWTSGDTSDQASGLCQGVYTVTITNTNGCRSSASATINEPSLLDAAITSVNVSCFGACNGTATANVIGGVTPYTYLWNDGALQTTQTATNLCSVPGGVTYTVTVSDANGCIKSKSILITQPTQLGLTQSIVSPTTCSSNNGSACVAAFGGVIPYTISWNDTNLTVDSCITNVFAGVYSATVMDGMSCTYTISVMINDIAGPTIDSIGAPPLNCYGYNNGTATVTISGGTPSFTYTWFNGMGSIISVGGNFIFGLNADNYTVMVQDGNQCVIADSFSITEPPLLASAITSFSNAACNGFCNGTATVLAVGGTLPYTYSWTNGQTTSNDTAMCAGNHNVNIIDANGCTDASQQTISQPAPLLDTIVTNNVSCNGLSDGDICLTPFGGTPPYTYLWNGGQTSNCISGLAAGIYTVTVTDNNGCIKPETISINQPLALSFTANTSASKCGNANGSATVYPIGGTSPYFYNWNDDVLQTSQNATGLLAGTYTVTITDNNNCTLIVPNILVNNIPGPVIDSVTYVDVGCNGNSTGSATVYSSGGTVPISYLWSNGQTNTTSLGLPAGQVSITVSDLNLCDTTATLTINEPAPIIATTTGPGPICYGQQALISASAAGGVSPYVYSWSNSVVGSAQSPTPLSTTIYNVTVTDANGCTEIASVSVTVMPPISVSVPDITICESDNGVLTTNVSGGTGIYTYLWNPSGSTSPSTTVSPALSTVYSVTVSDGCSLDDTATTIVTVNPKPLAGFNPGCFPNEFIMNFYDTSSVNSPAQIIQWQWDFGDIASGTDNTSTLQNPPHDFTDDVPYTVTLTVTTDQGCSATAIASTQTPPIANFTLFPTETSSLNPVVVIVDYSASALSDIASWQWDFGDFIIAGPGTDSIENVVNTTGTFEALTHTYTDTGLYYVLLTVENLIGCKDTMGVWVKIHSDFILFAPNAFSPSSFIEENMTFRPKIIGVRDTDFEFYVFDRWGDKAYEYKGLYSEWRGWDGTANGGKEKSQIDVYVILIRLTDLNDEDHEYLGHVTLLR